MSFDIIPVLSMPSSNQVFVSDLVWAHLQIGAFNLYVKRSVKGGAAAVAPAAVPAAVEPAPAAPAPAAAAPPPLGTPLQTISASFDEDDIKDESLVAVESPKVRIG